jgi:hypothetical protein
MLQFAHRGLSLHCYYGPRHKLTNRASDKTVHPFTDLHRRYSSIVGRLPRETFYKILCNPICRSGMRTSDVPHLSFCLR